MFGRRRYREITCVLYALAAALAAVLVGGRIRADGPLLDLLIKAREIVSAGDDRSEPSPVAVIALDKRSLDEPEIAAYPRTFLAPVWGPLLDTVFEAGARAVGFDLLFSYSANRFKPGFDRPFLAALGRHREKIVLARSATTLPAPPFLAALRFDEGGLGLGEIFADPDGKFRHVRAVYKTQNGSSLFSLVGALLVRAKAPSMPGEIVLAPRRHLEKIPTYALVDVLRCSKTAPEVLKKTFAGKIVLIGSTLAEEDRRISSGRFLTPQRTDSSPIHPCGLKRLGASVPDSQSVPGVFIHAAAVETVASGRVMLTAQPFAVAALSAATATAGSTLGMLLAPWLAFAVIVVIAILLFGAATGFLLADIWIPLGLPLVVLAAAPVIAYVVRYLAEERTRRRVQHAFSHYLSPMIVEKLASGTSTLKLGGELREVTVMFADLSGFTALSAKVEPDFLTRLTNQYLGYIVESVEATGGYVDKFIGDAVMAIWGAPVADPKHAVNGIRAAMASVARINQEKQAAESRGEIGFSVKIGLNSGSAVVGNVGTDKRYNYTAVGETVNVASRLEGVPSIYGCQIVVSQRTAEIARDEFLMCELDTIQVKGREAPLTVFEPIVGNTKATREQIDRVRRFAEALAYYRAMRFTEAYTVWETLAREEAASPASQDGGGGRLLNPSATMAERARAFAANPPAGPWDGVWVLTGK